LSILWKTLFLTVTSELQNAQFWMNYLYAKQSDKVVLFFYELQNRLCA